jgi:hypothetical protein
MSSRVSVIQIGKRMLQKINDAAVIQLFSLQFTIIKTAARQHLER